MTREYRCTECKHLLFKGSLDYLMKKRRPDAPPYIEMNCPECGHLNRLSPDPATEVIKSHPTKGLFTR